MVKILSSVMKYLLPTQVRKSFALSVVMVIIHYIFLILSMKMIGLNVMVVGVINARGQGLIIVRID